MIWPVYFFLVFVFVFIFALVFVFVLVFFLLLLSEMLFQGNHVDRDGILHTNYLLPDTPMITSCKMKTICCQIIKKKKKNSSWKRSMTHPQVYSYRSSPTSEQPFLWTAFASGQTTLAHVHQAAMVWPLVVTYQMKKLSVVLELVEAAAVVVVVLHYQRRQRYRCLECQQSDGRRTPATEPKNPCSRSPRKCPVSHRIPGLIQSKEDWC